jgi:hypothetical protein
LEKFSSEFFNVLFIFLSSGPYGSKSPRKGGEDPQLQLMVAKTAAMRFEELLVPQLDRLVPPLRLKEGSISPRYRLDGPGISPRDRRPTDPKEAAAAGKERKSAELPSPRDRKSAAEMPSPRERKSASELPSPREKMGEGVSPRGDAKEKSMTPRDDGGPEHK